MDESEGGVQEGDWMDSCPCSGENAVKVAFEKSLSASCECVFFCLFY